MMLRLLLSKQFDMLQHGDIYFSGYFQCRPRFAHDKYDKLCYCIDERGKPDGPANSPRPPATANGSGSSFGAPDQGLNNALMASQTENSFHETCGASVYPPLRCRRVHRQGFPLRPIVFQNAKV